MRNNYIRKDLIEFVSSMDFVTLDDVRKKLSVVNATYILNMYVKRGLIDTKLSSDRGRIWYDPEHPPVVTCEICGEVVNWKNIKDYRQHKYDFILGLFKGDEPLTNGYIRWQMNNSLSRQQMSYHLVEMMKAGLIERVKEGVYRKVK